MNNAQVWPGIDSFYLTFLQKKIVRMYVQIMLDSFQFNVFQIINKIYIASDIITIIPINSVAANTYILHMCACLRSTRCK